MGFMMKPIFILAVVSFLSLAAWSMPEPEQPQPSQPTTQPAASAQPGTLVLKSAGSIKNRSLVTRDVQLNHFLEKSLESTSKSAVVPLKADSPEMGFLVNQLLREWVVFLETGEMAVSEVSPKELDSALQTAREHLQRNPFYKNLEFNDKELREALNRKLKVRKFVTFKRDSASSPVTDSEAKKYFNENRGRFGADAKFEDFRESIQSALRRQNIDQRMQDWYAILLRKYEARNQLTDL